MKPYIPSKEFDQTTIQNCVYYVSKALYTQVLLCGHDTQTHSAGSADLCFIESPSG